MSIDFRARDFSHPLSIWRLRRRFERSQWFSRDQLADYRDRLLRETIEHAYAKVPYYQELFRRHRLTPSDFRTAADLPKLPTLSKATLREEFPRLRAVDAARYRPHLNRTSGTSGQPVPFLLDKPANVLEFVYYWRHWSWAGYRLGTQFAELTTGYFMRTEKRSRQPWSYQVGANRLLLNNMAMSPDVASKCVKAILERRPRFLKGLASALAVFAECVRQIGVTDLAFEAVFSTGEVLLAPQRALTERVFHAKVFDSYGHMERTVAISECADGGLHVNPEYGILELVAPRRVQPAHGSANERVFAGAVVGTSLHTRSMPLLRYQVGDVIEFEDPAPLCACGRAMPLVRRIDGRREDVITTPDGRVLTAVFLVFNAVPGIVVGQLLQDEPDRLVVRIARGAEYTSASETMVRALLARFVGRSMRIDVEYWSPDALRAEAPGKFRAVRSLVTNPLVTWQSTELVSA